MIFNKYINNIKNFILYCLECINNEKVIIYTVFFIVFFFMYYLLTIPQLLQDKGNNKIYEFIEKNRKTYWYLPTVIAVNIILITWYIFLIIKYKLNKSTYTELGELKIILIVILLFALLIFFDIITFTKELSIINQNFILRIILFIAFAIIFTIFFAIFGLLFFYNINNQYNAEFYISIGLITMYLLEYILTSITSINKLYYQLKNDDFSTLTVNCSPNIQNKEKFTSDGGNNTSQQIIDINKQYGDNYLKTIGNIPISFYNKNINEYQDFILADFYYPGSYYTYLANSPLNGTPSLDAIKIALSLYNVRFIHLDLYSDSSDPYDPKANPVIRCENMSEGANSLNLEEVFGLINKWAWVNNDSNNLSYPLFLYLNCNFENANENIYVKIYKSLLKFFSKYFIDKKYSFSGRNSTFLVSMAKLKECLGKIIILSNTYPTKTVLDELINASSNNINSSFTLNEYKQNYINFDKVGLSQDNDKNVLVNNAKTNLSFYYTIPNKDYKNDSQVKAGLFNASFQDCAQYGIQGTLMYIFVPDDNLNKWILFFKNKNNMNPVLKDESLRYIILEKQIITKQEPITALQAPQKYCLIPGLLSTEKSNLSGSVTNGTCR